jgi:hypothetical protein
LIAKAEFLKVVPRHAILNLCAPGGRRSKKKVSLTTRGHGQYYGPCGGFTPGASWQPGTRWDAASGKYVPMEPEAEIPGNLANDDYRYWIGMPHSSAMFSKCRMCGEPATSPYARRDHASHNQCCRNLVAIYKLLLAAKPRICAVCACATDNQKWGFPLCKTGSCQRDWKFGMTNRKFEGFERAKHKALVLGKLIDIPGDTA